MAASNNFIRAILGDMRLPALSPRDFAGESTILNGQENHFHDGTGSHEACLDSAGSAEGGRDNVVEHSMRQHKRTGSLSWYEWC